MITKMKKLTLLVSKVECDVDADLNILGQLGVMHMVPFQAAKHESIERVSKRINQLNKAISVLDLYDDKHNESEIADEKLSFTGKERGEIALLEKVLDFEQDRIHFESIREEQSQQLNWFNEWGSISIADVNELRDKGIFIKLYLLRGKEVKSINAKENVYIFGKDNDLHKVAVIRQNPDKKLDFPEIPFPDLEKDTLKNELAKTNSKLEEIYAQLLELNKHKSALQEALDERIHRLNLRNVKFGGLNIENKVRCWEGYIPEQTTDKIITTANDHGWGYIIEDPSEKELDVIPTQIQSPKWADRIRPVMNFMGLVPGYNELDVSKVFMIFFTFFAGILVGDAAYGLIFLLITLLVHKKQKFKPKIEFQLFYTLSASILFWGILTGTYFGSQMLAGLPVLNEIKINKLASFGGDDIFTQKFMFIVGAIHLSIGRLQMVWRYINSVKAIAQFGWVGIIWGLYLVVNNMVLGLPKNEFTVWFFIIGALLIILFSNPEQKFFKGMLTSIASLPLSVINGFSDIISYIRLYAVGLATVLMAASFNEMAIGSGISTVISGIGAVIILILGHGLNMILAGMAVIVHGVRLNMLEYAGHAGVEFSGNEYNPFKLKNKKE